jgi:hypothetical protein
MRMISGAIGGIKIGTGNRSTQRKPAPAPLCPPQNPTWPDPGSNPDHRGGKPVTNRLSYGAAPSLHLIITLLQVYTIYTHYTLIFSVYLQ